jgi:ectoine hydroxylase-related dioxygenase (phytanoyl-CoA dioxygenase family)
LVLKNFLTTAEITKIYTTAISDQVLKNNAQEIKDNAGKNSKLTLWFKPGNDIYSMLIRSERMVNAAAALLDSNASVCHFHTKLMQKEPKIGGAWEWHQDYGYWYKNEFLFPDQLISIMVALTNANQLNGCLQVIKGSHKLGRVNHGFSGEQVGADMVMVSHALNTMEHIYVELEMGDALIFHSNLLHRSEGNTSDTARWSMISCYNSKSNPAYNDSSSAWSEPIESVPDSAIMDANFSGAELATDFLQKEKDPGLKETGWEQQVQTT